MKDSKTGPASGNTDVAVAGRGSIFTIVGEWVALAPISDRAARLYWLLRAHVNQNRKLDDDQPDETAFPSQDRLAAMLGVNRRQTVAAAIAELVEVKAIDMRTERYANGQRARNIYTVHLDPPPGYTGTLCTNDFEISDGVTADPPSDQPESAKPQVSPTCATAHPAGCASAHSNQTKNNQTKKDQKSSPPARPHADARGRERTQADKRKLNREARRAWELPPRDDRSWLSLDNDDLAEDILDWADKKYSCAEQARNMVEDMIFRPGYNPMRILNAALKVGRDNFEITDDEPLPTWLTEELPAEPVPVPAQSTVSDSNDPWRTAR